MIKVLFAEDEAILGLLVKEALEREQDFEVDWVKDGKAALVAFGKAVPDICILDVMMPLIDGFTVARQMRDTNKQLPIIFLTARSQTSDVVKGFDSGGDDYLKKPFSVEELVVRIRSLLRRSASKAGPVVSDTHELFCFGTYEFSSAAQVLRCGDVKFNLTNRESELLRELLLHKNSLLDRKKVLLQLWGDDNFFNARNMDVYIAKLRKYLAHDASLAIINVRGFGYKLTEQ